MNKEKVYQINKVSEISRESDINDVWSTALAINKLIDLSIINGTEHLATRGEIGKTLRNESKVTTFYNENNEYKQKMEKAESDLSLAIDRSQLAKDRYEKTNNKFEYGFDWNKPYVRKNKIWDIPFLKDQAETIKQFGKFFKDEFGF
jgi:hypothetical protein